MTLLAIGALAAIFSWIGLVVGVVVLVAVIALFQRVLQAAVETADYVDATLEAAGGIARHLEGAGELATTRDLAQRLVPR